MRSFVYIALALMIVCNSAHCFAPSPLHRTRNEKKAAAAAHAARLTGSMHATERRDAQPDYADVAKTPTVLVKTFGAQSGALLAAIAATSATAGNDAAQVRRANEDRMKQLAYDDFQRERVFQESVWGPLVAITQSAERSADAGDADGSSSRSSARGGTGAGNGNGGGVDDRGASLHGLVPRAVSIDLENTRIVYEYVDNAYTLHDSYDHLTEFELSEIYQSLLDSLFALHKHPYKNVNAKFTFAQHVIDAERVKKWSQYVKAFGEANRVPFFTLSQSQTSPAKQLKLRQRRFEETTRVLALMLNNDTWQAYTHGDICPDNVLLQMRDDGDRVRLLDFSRSMPNRHCGLDDVAPLLWPTCWSAAVAPAAVRDAYVNELVRRHTARGVDGATVAQHLSASLLFFALHHLNGAHRKKPADRCGRRTELTCAQAVCGRFEIADDLVERHLRPNYASAANTDSDELSHYDIPELDELQADLFEHRSFALDLMWNRVKEATSELCKHWRSKANARGTIFTSMPLVKLHSSSSPTTTTTTTKNAKEMQTNDNNDDDDVAERNKHTEL